MKTPFTFLLLLLAPLTLFSQNAKIDSLKHVIETTKVDTVRGRTLCRLCGELVPVRAIKEALANGEKGLKISQKVRDVIGEGSCFNALGLIYRSQGLNDRALECFIRSLQLLEKTGDKMRVAGCLINLGSTYAIRGNLDRALDYSLKGVKLAESVGMSYFVSNGLLGIGELYMKQGDYAKALHYLQRSLKIKTEIGNKAGLAAVYNSVGNMYFLQRDFAKANEAYAHSLKINEDIGSQGGIGENLGNIGNVYYEKGDYSQSLDYRLRSLKIFAEIGYSYGLAMAYANVSKNYLQLGALDSARVFAQQGVSIGQTIGDLYTQNIASQALYQADSALGNWKAAFEAHRLYKIYSDSMKNDEQSRELGRLESKAEYEKQAEIDRLKNEAEKKRERERFAWMLGSAGGGLLLLLIIAFTLFRGRLKEKKANAALRSLNEEIKQQKAEIEAINSELQITLDEVNEKKVQIEEQHAKIEDSIRYASRIQGAILPKAEDLQAALPAHFIHFQPRDIVSGDFYWMTTHPGKTFLAAVDCTGHGVPGAFMSVLGSNLLHQIVDENQITEPDVILSELDRRIAATLRQQFGGDSKDGMDLALIVLHEADKSGRRTVEYAGAGRPLWHWSNGEITEYKSAKYSCGGSQHEGKTYPAHRIEVKAGDRLYLFSDGPVDQFGGPNGRKLGSTQLQSFLAETANLPIEEQGKRFGAFFNDWMKAKKQLDDVLLAGVAL